MNPVIATPTKQIFNGKPYYLCGKYFQNGGERLHRVVYAFYNGPIPRGMAVHHIDENRANNSIENLMLMRLGEHTAHHNVNDKRPIPAATIKAAAIWHGTTEGIEWHRQQYEATKDRLHAKKKINCIVCAKDVMVTNIGSNLFCSAKCCTKNRRDSGIDDESRKCEYCFSIFIVNKYKPNRFCCRACSSRFNAEKRT